MAHSETTHKSPSTILLPEMAMPLSMLVGLAGLDPLLVGLVHSNIQKSKATLLVHSPRNVLTKNGHLRNWCKLSRCYLWQWVKVWDSIHSECSAYKHLKSLFLRVTPWSWLNMAPPTPFILTIVPAEGHPPVWQHVRRCNAPTHHLQQNLRPHAWSWWWQSKYNIHFFLWPEMMS